jgi:hypothetical protein
MTKTKSLYHGHRFPATTISNAVRWYWFQLSLRDIEELLFERGVTVSYETIRRWCEKFGAGFAHRVKAARQGRRQTFLQACAALEPGATQDRYRSIAQLSGRECRHPGIGKREACVRQGCGPCQQSCREQPSAHAGARAAYARLSRPEAHAGFPVEIRSDPSARRIETTSAARFSLSQTPRGPVRRMARTY